MRRFREWFAAARVWLAAIGVAVVGMLLYGWRRYRQGVDVGAADERYRDDIGDVRRTEASGDTDSMRDDLLERARRNGL